MTSRGTSGIVVTFGTHVWLMLSSTQVPISLSSAEAEFYGLAKAGSRGIGIFNLAKDFGFDKLGLLDLELLSDSSSAIGVAIRRGVGKIRHLETGSLWLQQAVAQKRFLVTKVDGKKNPADARTKHVEGNKLCEHMRMVNLHISEGRHHLAPHQAE